MQWSPGVLYSNDNNLVLTYLSNNELNFTPLFVEALAVLLSSYLAGPILKGDVGVAAQQKQMGLVWHGLEDGGGE